MMTATQLKAALLAVLDEVEGGESIDITRHGRVIARLGPAAAAQHVKGSLRGVATSTPADEELFSTGEAWDTT